MRNTLDSVYFEVGCHKVRLRDVKEIYFIREHEYSIPDVNSKVGTPIMLSQFQVPRIQHKMFSVKILFESCLGSESRKRINLGDKLNLASGIKDLTLDHVIPIRKVLDDNISQLPYLAKISYAKEISPSKKIKDICKTINFGDTKKECIIKELNNELDLIVKETHGLRICAMRAN